MKNKSIKAKLTASIIALTASITSGSASAGDIEGEIISAAPSVYMDSTINGVALDKSAITATFLGKPGVKAALDSIKENKKSSVGIQAAATGISYYEVYAVGSSNIGWEQGIPSYQTITTYDHGGAQLRVAVLQVGYGNDNDATMGGMTAGSYYEERLCGADLHFPCNSGETISGWLRYYAFDGLQNGIFNTSSNSTAFPFGYWSDSISVR